LEELNTGLERKVAERTANLMDAYRRLEEQNKILQELDQLKSDFVSMVSHELRNPLNNLGGGLELLLARPKRKNGDQGTLALMQAEVRRLTRFVESILDVSALEAGRLELHLAPISLVPILEQLNKHPGTAEATGRIQLEVQPDLPEVIAAQTALESVLRHLVDNAIKYAPEGPVIVSAARDDGQVYIRVRDFGPGIAEDKQKLLFERFQRLDARDSQSIYGYGLGLYLSRRLLEEMGSTLTFDAPEGGGARFSFSLQAANP
jgi:signal transduction histidine kinase